MVMETKSLRSYFTYIVTIKVHSFLRDFDKGIVKAAVADGV